MKTVIEPEPPTPAPPRVLLTPLHLSYGSAVRPMPEVSGGVSYDERRQITLLDGVPLAQVDDVLMMATKSIGSSDGNGPIAVDEGPDDA